MDHLYKETENTDNYNISGNDNSSQRSRNDGVVPDFIQKLFNMLETTDETSCYHWGRQGTTFVIDDTNEFAKTILPRRFKHGNFSSFVRQLNKYDFHKIRFTDNHKLLSPTHQQAWEFQHPLFRRDRKHLLAQIHRKVNSSRAHQIKQRQSTINKTSQSSSSTDQQRGTSQGSESDAAMTVASFSTSSSPTITMQHLHDIQNSLQAQIDQLCTTQRNMESTLTQLLSTDTLLLEEMNTMKRKLEEKDYLLNAALNQSKQHSLYPLQQNKSLPVKETTTMDDSPIPSPQSPSLKLYPWLHPNTTTPTSSSTSSSSPPSLISPPIQQHHHHHHLHQSQTTSTTPPLTAMNTPLDSSSPTALTTTAKKEVDIIPEHHQSYPTSSSSSSLTPCYPHDHPILESSLPAISSSVPASSSLPTLSSFSAAIPTSSPNLPLIKAELLTPPIPTEEPSCAQWRQQPKVLVVEDNVMYRRISMRCLQRLGCAFDLACDGLEAVACMKTTKYDLILMDISIPKLDGMAATRRLRQYDQHTPVVSMTANYSDKDIDKYIGSGMSDLLPKPFDHYKLYDILKQHCVHLI
ncbi:uncharacterized protein BX664DRAFT_278374 [Halteromyces radiatus]|uniref:uncharacterized protein n=1 Tax=Halteromyces radiatus TaxID=101107 RepID=UPI00221E5C7E|nr:uncharacterized protein BX664DRAFT_278374 [Halteromyces radiatus]KAI8093417.1 hypothetical protein BX664DRAFT_278374 [Halteromyces radiatus]